ncbi:MAG: hypothetical protein ACTHKB_07170, partial [Burkholderiaceae bacterium]
MRHQGKRIPFSSTAIAVLAAGALLSSLSSLSALAAPAAPAATAGSYPDKEVRIIVPYAPGGGADMLARVIGQKLSAKWGQPVVVENRA